MQFPYLKVGEEKFKLNQNRTEHADANVTNVATELRLGHVIEDIV